LQLAEAFRNVSNRINEPRVMLRVVSSAVRQLEKVQGRSKSENIREFEKDDEEAAKHHSHDARAGELVGVAIFIRRFVTGTLDRWTSIVVCR
jgi:hypothetical protein